MSKIASQSSVVQKNTYFGPAEVLDVNEDKGLILLKLLSMGQIVKTWGRSAVPYPHHYSIGDTVLVAGEDIDAVYIIGLLSNTSSEENCEKRIDLKDGSYASIAESAECGKFQLCSKSGELLFEYDPETGKRRVSIHSGDLDFITENGSINFISGRDIRFKSSQNIDMESPYGIRMAVTNAIGRMISSLSLNSGKMRLSSPNLGITAQRGEMQIQDTKYIGDTFSGTVKHARMIAVRLETLAREVIGKAKNVYHTIEGLTQWKTGRMKTLVDSTLHMKAKKSYMKSTEDFKINADKIHLG